MRTFAGMKREVYESQKAFAGEKKPSMLRRCVGHDYNEHLVIRRDQCIALNDMARIICENMPTGDRSLT